MDIRSETLLTWNKVADAYQQKFMFLDIYNHTYDIVCSEAKQNAQVLDIGCGPGNITHYLLQKRPDFEVLCIDAAPDMIALAAQSNPAATFKVMDINHLQSVEQLFDVVVCGFAIPYLSPEETSDFIRQCGIRLVAGGLCYLSFVAGSPFQSGFKTGSSGDRVYFYYHQTQLIEAALQQSEFVNIRIMEVPYTLADGTMELHTVIIATKA